MSWLNPKATMEELRDSREAAVVSIDSHPNPVRVIFAGGAVEDSDEAVRVAGESLPVFCFPEIQAMAEWGFSAEHVAIAARIKSGLGNQARILSDAEGRVTIEAQYAHAALGLGRSAIQSQWKRWPPGGWQREAYKRSRAEARDAGVDRIEAANLGVYKVREEEARRAGRGLSGAANQTGG